ncbi:hypothetical protein DdX_03030 [Ditylenchus destructor]|uniref:Uncharacterized protein n=1 Tax=Ditylenchus destructor TaxID=166010 RepID=A0AAD4R6J2_9BILA|nr:hypothetical protein DdX_03030 [Ditylenchus destructor]
MEAAGVLPASGIVVHATTKSRSFYWPLRPAVHNNWVGQVKGICPGGKEDDKPTAGRKVRFREAGGMEARQASSDNTTSSESPSEGRVENNEADLLPNTTLAGNCNSHHKSSTTSGRSVSQSSGSTVGQWGARLSSSSSSGCQSPHSHPGRSMLPHNGTTNVVVGLGRRTLQAVGGTTDLQSRYTCLCGGCHVVMGTKCFLLMYICLTICGMVFGMVSAMVWALIPLIVIPLSVYGFKQHKPKYLYPLLIVTIIQLIVCLMMSAIVGVFTLFNRDRLTSILAHSTAGDPSMVLTLMLIFTISCCFLMAGMSAWQVVVISSCIDYYENWQRRHPYHSNAKSLPPNGRRPTCHSVVEPGGGLALRPIPAMDMPTVSMNEKVSQVGPRSSPPVDGCLKPDQQYSIPSMAMTNSTTLYISSHPASSVTQITTRRPSDEEITNRSAPVNLNQS